ncbi:hypothetical protein T492DRAFT_993916 [Pavlovales sp. CCMP2436]|nr:hypothetical protein T492DRAFT_993916 [Pavlovales sp. CCMP2436]
MRLLTLRSRCFSKATDAAMRLLTLRSRCFSKATDAAKEEASSSPILPICAILLSAPIVGFKSGILNLEQIPEHIRSTLPIWLTKFVLAKVPPVARVPAVPSPAESAQAAPAAMAALPSSTAPSDVRAYLTSNRPRIVALLWTELAAVTKQESWLKFLTAPLTSISLGRQRRAILEQLALRE